jgi:hypothetical protein
MTKDSINAIIRCAFKLCFIYFLKYFIPPLNFGPHIGLCAITNYEKELHEQIAKLKELVLSHPTNNEPKIHKSKKEREENDDLFTKTDNHDAAIKEAAYDEIKKTIVNKLKEEHGDNICVEFTYQDNEELEKNKVLYSLKIKEIGKDQPPDDKFKESEIYVNTKTKTFHVKTDNGFKSFPLIKRSVIRCEKTN